MSCCDIWEIFDEKNNLIKDYKYWKLLVRNRNTTLGNCVAILKRHIENFSDIHFEEMMDFANVVKDIEASLKRAFSYDKINYLMLMMKDKHVHFHIIPRYALPKIFADMEWTDNDWPVAVAIKAKENIASETLKKIKEKIIENLSK